MKIQKLNPERIQDHDTTDAEPVSHFSGFQPRRAGVFVENQSKKLQLRLRNDVV
jgi:hypothetical protein